jgi:hypothetical protein
MVVTSGSARRLIGTRSMSDQSPPRKAFGRPPNLDVERCPLVELGKHIPDQPEYSEWALIYDPHPTTPRWWLTFLPFIVTAEHPDGLIEVRNPDGSIDRYRSPGAVAGNRQFLQVSKEEAEALARRCGKDLPPGFFPADEPNELPQYVTRDQAAALVNLTSDGLRHYRKKGMPEPAIRGTKGRRNEYLWSEMRPWLEKTFNRKIPDVAILKFRMPDQPRST